MKNSFKTIICAVAFSALFAFNVSANDKETKKVNGFATGIFANKEGKINVNVDKYNDAETVIILIDQRGSVIYREVLGNSLTKFRRTLDVSQLPYGSYRLQVSSKGEKITKAFDVAESVARRVITVN